MKKSTQKSARRKLPAWMAAPPVFDRGQNDAAVAGLDLNPQQLAALNHHYYTVFKGGVGMRALYESMRNAPLQSSPDRVSWRDLRGWVGAQAVNQLYRRAKTINKSRASIPRIFEPFVIMECDLIDLGSKKDKATNTFKWQSEGYRYVFNCIDIVTRFTWQFPIKKKEARETARAFTTLIDSVRAGWGGRWPRATVLITDNGTEFEDSFERAVVTYEAQIRVQHGKPHDMAATAAVENSNKAWRGQMRQVLYTKKTLKWSRLLDMVNANLNNTPNHALAYLTPTDVYEAFREPDATSDDIIKRARNAAESAVKRRRKANAVVETPLQVGDQVRLVNQQYLKAQLRGNELKMMNRWSKRVYTVKRVRISGEMADQNAYQLNTGKPEWYTLDHLQVVQRNTPPQEPPANVQDREDFEALVVSGQRMHQPTGAAVPRQEWLTTFRGYPYPEYQPHKVGGAVVVPRRLIDAFLSLQQ